MSKPQQRGYITCIPRAHLWAASERCGGYTSFTCVLTSHEGQQSFVRETHLDQLRKRARSAKTARSHLTGPVSQYASTSALFSSASMSGTDIALRNATQLAIRVVSQGIAHAAAIGPEHPTLLPHA